MSKKHFIKLAEALKAERPLPSWAASKHGQWNLDVKAVANVCASFNVMFQREKFYAACGGLFE